MTTLNERIENELNRAFWRLSVETSTAARSGANIIRATNKFHDCVFAGTSDAHCLGCGEDWPCESILIIANELKIEVNN